MSSSKPLVSIALCTYNGAAYLEAQLNSLVNQSYPHIEIIAVDDGSTDDTVNILKRYTATHTQLKLYQNEVNLGYVKNFEKAISLTKGEFIALSDQDDIWDLNKISLMVDNIGSNILLYHDSAFINEQGELLGKKMSDMRKFYRGGDSRIFLMENCISGHSIIFRRELLNHFTGFNQTIIHDWWLGYIALNNGTIDFLPQTLVQYRQHQTTTTNILRLDRGENKKKSESLKKIESQLAVTEAFAAYPFNQEIEFKQKLLKPMQNRMESYFSFSLAWFVFKQRDTLLYIPKKSKSSKLNFIIKMIWGYKLKKLFNS